MAASMSSSSSALATPADVRGQRSASLSRRSAWLGRRFDARVRRAPGADARPLVSGVPGCPCAVAARAATRFRRYADRFDLYRPLNSYGFFESIRHDLVERAVAHHTDIPWVRLYIAQWLRAPLRRLDRTLGQRTKGTPQGGNHHPLFANLLHYAFDLSMQRRFRTSCSSAMRTMPSSIAGPSSRRSGCSMPSVVDSCSAVWSFIRRRLGLSTAKMTTGRRSANTSRSTFSVTPSSHDEQRIAGGSTSSAFFPR